MEEIDLGSGWEIALEQAGVSHVVQHDEPAPLGSKKRSFERFF
jgi:hypothetical protein